MKHITTLLLTLLVLGGCGDISKSNFKGVYSSSGDTSEMVFFFGDKEKFRVGAGIAGWGTYKLDCDWFLTGCNKITLIYEEFRQGEYCTATLTRIDSKKVLFESEDCLDLVLIKLNNPELYNLFNETKFNPKLFNSSEY